MENILGSTNSISFVQSVKDLAGKITKKQAIGTVSIAVVAGIVAGVLFIPHTITVTPEVTEGTRAAKLQFKEESYTVKASLYAAINGNVKLNSKSSGNFTFTGYTNPNKYLSLTGDNVNYLFNNYDITADYVPNKYQVDLYDGKTMVQSMANSYGSNLILPSEGITTSKHPYEDFAGWKSKDGKVETNVPVTEGKDVAFTSIWTGKKYKINYDLGGGSASNPATYKYHEGVKALNNASKAGYIFDGWYSDAGHTKRVTSIPSDSHADMTLYAAYHEIPKPVVVQPVVRNVSNGRYYRNNSGYGVSNYNTGSGYSSGSTGYNWSAVAHGEQAQVDQGNLIQYDDYGNYFAAHDSTAYGRAIAGMKAGDGVTVNGRHAVIDGQFVVNRGNTYMEDVMNRIPGGENSPAFQTCIDHNGNVVIKYGHYTN